MVFVVAADERRRSDLVATLHSMNFRHEAYSGLEEFLENFAEERPGCVILDAASCVDSLNSLTPKADDPQLPPVIFITDDVDVGLIVRAMRSGAVDFLFRRSYSESELWEAIQSGLSRDEKNRAEQAERRERLRRLSLLTAVEREVLDLLLAGKNNRQISEQTGATRGSIEARRARVMKKLGVPHLPALIRFAVAAEI